MPVSTASPRLQQARARLQRLCRRHCGQAWLAGTPDGLWQDVAQESNSPMDGKRLRQVWSIITGTQSRG